METNRQVPGNFTEFEAQLGPGAAPFRALFDEAIEYFDSLLGQEGRSSPGLERSYVDRFLELLRDAGFARPTSPREILIRLCYGYHMTPRDTIPADPGGVRGSEPPTDVDTPDPGPNR